MRVLVTGAAGMLGTDLCTVLAEAEDIKFTAMDRRALDITAPDSALEAVDGHDLVVNCAAWTGVDLAETQEEQATAINGAGARNLAAASASAGARFIQVSTDYVFPGDAAEPIPEDAPTAPINAYGRGKLVGEQAVLNLLPDSGYVVRTAWLYGAHGRNFVATMLRLAGERDTLDVVDDQIGQPTWTVALARQLLLLARAAHSGRAPAGVYHGTAAGRTTWHGLASAAFELAGLDPARVRPTTSGEFVQPAKRPGYSVLGHAGWRRAGLEPMGQWRAELESAFAAGVFQVPVV
jgi:dTDP-4-dehydrorhamnose reductase